MFGTLIRLNSPYMPSSSENMLLFFYYQTIFTMKKLAPIVSLFALLTLAVACNDESRVVYFYYTPEESAILNQYLNLPESPD